MPRSSAFAGTVDDVRAAVWLEALTRHSGNIARASQEFGFSKQRGHALTKRHGLVETAAQLRANAGQPDTGRPRKLKKGKL